MNNQPEILQEFDAMICWLGQRPLNVGNKYIIRQTTREGKALLKEIVYKIDLEKLNRKAGITELHANDIARIKLKTTTPFMIDSYRQNRVTGSFILIEEGSNNTVAAGMIIIS
jgi:sulfate adenylyltransferase subunit 1